MFSYETSVKLHYTDAAGLVFYGSIFTMIHDAYEGFLAANGLEIARIFKEKKYHLPIVHAEADYKRRQSVGEKVVINVGCETIGDHSFTLLYTILNGEGETAGTAKTVHVAVNKKTWKKTEIPPNLLHILRSSQ